jgi:hypothetical protein
VSSKSDTGSGKPSWFGRRINGVVNEPSGSHLAVAGLGVIEVIAIPPGGRHDFLAPMRNRNDLDLDARQNADSGLIVGSSGATGSDGSQRSVCWRGIT